MFTNGYINVKVSPNSYKSYPLYNDVMDVGDNYLTVNVPSKFGTINDTLQYNLSFVAINTTGPVENSLIYYYKVFKINKPVAYDIEFIQTNPECVLKIQAGDTLVYIQTDSPVNDNFYVGDICVSNNIIKI